MNDTGEKFEVTERLIRTKDGTVVPESEAVDGGYLFAAVGQRIPIAEAVKHGLVKPKQRPKPADKKVRKVADK